ncbi:hypothetical protein FQN57_004234 [Myotisia sp. PD_48]|nr:hypothetical protein FQN57_004234 [Myotisia sp. PD_48]
MAPSFSNLAVNLGLALSLFGSAQAIPSPDSLQTELTILLHNDLYGDASPRDEAVIILGSPKSKPDAEAACQALGETLWVPPASGIEFLKYLGYPDRGFLYNDYWVGPGSSSGCITITPEGKIKNRSCVGTLPALCTQSAGYTHASRPADTAAKWQTTVKTGNQLITGYRDKLSFRFQGIRYAQQPQRFTHSELYEGSGASTALKYSVSCPLAFCSPENPCSEDCLFLNVWTPYLPKSQNSPPKKLRPVMFWMHGGGYEFGSGTDPTFDGANAAARGDVVIVTINYRLNTLGFLALKDGVTTGNYGLGDQMIALDWVRAHIKDFGGDPNRITIYGQSAGAASVRVMLGAPQAQGKYAAAISMSNLGGYAYGKTYSHYYTIEEQYEEHVKPMLALVGCDTAADKLQCLRGVEASEFGRLDPVAVVRYPVVDGKFIKKQELPLDGTGGVPNVPFIMGTTRHDGAVFIKRPWTADLEEALTVDLFNASAIINSGAFPKPGNPDPIMDTFSVSARVATDGEMRCLDRATAYAGTKNGVFSNAWLYETDLTYSLVFFPTDLPICNPPKTPEHPDGDLDGEFWSCHSGDLYYTFGTIVLNGIPIRGDKDMIFSQYFVDQWTSFARTHDPNPDPEYLRIRGYTNTTATVNQSGRWNKMNPTSPQVRLLNVPSRHIPFDEVTQCNVLELPLDYYM